MSPDQATSLPPSLSKQVCFASIMQLWEFGNALELSRAEYMPFHYLPVVLPHAFCFCNLFLVFVHTFTDTTSWSRSGTSQTRFTHSFIHAVMQSFVEDAPCPAGRCKRVYPCKRCRNDFSVRCIVQLAPLTIKNSLGTPSYGLYP